MNNTRIKYYTTSNIYSYDGKSYANNINLTLPFQFLENFSCFISLVINNVKIYSL